MTQASMQKLQNFKNKQQLWQLCISGKRAHNNIYLAMKFFFFFFFAEKLKSEVFLLYIIVPDPEISAC